MSESVSLKEYLNSRIDDVKESVKTAYAAMEKRLEGMNEFRSQLKDQAGRFVTREEMDQRFTSTNARIEALQRIVWIGIGISLALQFVFQFFVKVK